MSRGIKKTNEYTRALRDSTLTGLDYSTNGAIYDACPKAVFAAIAVSALTCGGDQLEWAAYRVMREWWSLYHNGIVTQKPPFPEPPAVEAEA